MKCTTSPDIKSCANTARTNHMNRTDEDVNWEKLGLGQDRGLQKSNAAASLW